ncbi:hypothetical protein BD770DRAFT_403342 [Pilaira anomala]|nr:hypothetical protein BD770DRAFT_403342 [Pilaira anomala]
MVDMTNRDCLNFLSQVLCQIEPSYLTHKLAVVLTKVDMPKKWNMEKQEVHKLVAPYKDLQLFYVNLTVKSNSPILFFIFCVFVKTEF